MLFAQNTFIFPTETPLKRSVFLEKPIMFFGITINSLVENKFGIVYDSCDYKLIKLVVIESSKPLSGLRMIDCFEIINKFFLFSNDDMIFQNLPLLAAGSFNLKCIFGLKSEVFHQFILIINDPSFCVPTKLGH